MPRLSELVAELTGLIKINQTIKAMERFYADDVTTLNAARPENETAPRIRKTVCLAHERQLVASVKQMTAQLIKQATNERTGTVFSEWHMEAAYSSGKRFSLTEVSVQYWWDGFVFKE